MVMIKYKLTSLICKLAHPFWIALLIMVTFSSAHVKAKEQEWWFDIEVILFKRDISPADVAEQFPQEFNLAKDQVLIDLLGKHLYPDLSAWYNALPVCFASDVVEPALAFKFDPFPYIEMQADSFALASSFDPFDQQLASYDTAPTSAAEQHNMTQSAGNQDDQSTQIELEDGRYFSERHLALAVPFDPRTLVKIPDQLLCRYQGQPLIVPFISDVPRVISSREFPTYKGSQLLNSSHLELQEMAKDIGRQRGLSPLLHMGWRQQVYFGQENSVPMRVFAGQNFAKLFDQKGLAISIGNPQQTSQIESDILAQMPQTQDSEKGNLNQDVSIEIDLIEKIRQALMNELSPPDNNVLTVNSPLISSDEIESQNSELNQLWELEGSVNVFLRYIQRTPYLHVDSQFDFRSPVFAPSTPQSDVTQNPISLQSYPFSQLRRVISQQIHYFDHPMFGMIIQIRRHEFSEPQEETKD